MTRLDFFWFSRQHWMGGCTGFIGCAAAGIVNEFEDLWRSMPVCVPVVVCDFAPPATKLAYYDAAPHEGQGFAAPHEGQGFESRHAYIMCNLFESQMNAIYHSIDFNKTDSRRDI